MEYLIFAGNMFLSIVLGGLLGWQREHIGKDAGLRTYALVSFGSTLFTLLSLAAFPDESTGRVAAQIVTGVGFLCAGTIIHKKGGIDGLTTAAGLWSAAAVGMAIGAGWHIHAIIATLLMFFLLILPSKIWD
ncbi:MAG TPA: MgtC/SapB family protein [Candidatus Kapabacteria bacterium]|nr:MgtC/SapB family protein [Candidatus Kapabacteria bacterium]